MDQQHKKQFSNVESWVDSKVKYLNARAHINSVSMRSFLITNNRRFLMLKPSCPFSRHMRRNLLPLPKSTLLLLPNSVKAFFQWLLLLPSICLFLQAYNSKYSSFVCENPEEIKTRHSTIASQWSNLKELAQKLKHDLDASLALEMEKERLRLEYAHLALQFTQEVTEANKSLAIETFGFVLEEVQDYKKKIEESRASLSSDADSKVANIKTVKADMDKIGVTENIYSQLTLADIDNTRSELAKNIANRDARYQKELDRQIYNDNLCKKFAGVSIIMFSLL